MFFKPIDKGKGKGGGDDTSCYLPANKNKKLYAKAMVKKKETKKEE